MIKHYQLKGYWWNALKKKNKVHLNLRYLKPLNTEEERLRLFSKFKTTNR